MSNLLQTYANFCGIKVTKRPKIIDSFYPIPDSYITIHPESGMPSKDYDYYNEVISLVKPYLDKENIEIVQIGTEKDKILNGVIPFTGKTNISQCAYVVKNSKLHVGNDSVWAHVAGNFNIPLVELFGPTLSNVCAPSFKSKFIAIESNRKGLKPTFTASEDPKTINYIRPEEVAKSILQLLEISNSINVESLYFGKNYNKEVIEIVPNHLINPALFKDIKPFIRLDYLFDQNNLAKILNTVPCIICTSHPLDPNLIAFYRDKIIQILYIIKEDYNLDFIKFLHQSTIDYRIICDQNILDINKVRLELFDYNPVIEIPSFDKSNLENSDKITEHTYVKTTKVLLSNGKPYLSKWHWINKIPMENENQIGNALEKELFWENANYYYLYNKDETK